MTEKFTQICKDFINDLIRTFPDKITNNNNAYLYNFINNEDEENLSLEIIGADGEVNKFPNMYEYCKEIYPKQFFNILYENEEIFLNQDKLELLPGINFIELWNEDISDNTKAIIWKYLQLILFCIINELDSDESFGDTAKLFEAINQDEFKKKIEETIDQMGNIFNKEHSTDNVDNVDNTDTADNTDNKKQHHTDLPNAEELHSHINQMMEGKLGCLAKEIAEETAQDLDINIENVESVDDVFKQLFKNPGKLMNLVQTVGSKLDNKLKSGNIKESELLAEASELVNKMKNMPGMGDFENMFSKMGLPGMGKGAKGGKVDMGAFSKTMEQNIRSAKMKERMRTKLDNNNNTKSILEQLTNKATEINRSNDTTKPNDTTDNTNLSDILNDINLDQMKEYIFSTGDTVERSNKLSNKKKKKPKGKKK